MSKPRKRSPEPAWEAAVKLATTEKKRRNLISFAKGKVGLRQVAEDLVQEAIRKTLKARPKCVGNADGYLKKVLRRDISKYQLKGQPLQIQDEDSLVGNRNLEQSIVGEMEVSRKVQTAFKAVMGRLRYQTKEVIERKETLMLEAFRLRLFGEGTALSTVAHQTGVDQWLVRQLWKALVAEIKQRYPLPW